METEFLLGPPAVRGPRQRRPIESPFTRHNLVLNLVLVLNPKKMEPVIPLTFVIDAQSNKKTRAFTFELHEML